MIYDNQHMNDIQREVNAFNETGDDLHLARIIMRYGIDGVLMLQNTELATAYLIQRPELLNDERIPDHLRERTTITHLRALDIDIYKTIKGTFRYIDSLVPSEKGKDNDLQFIMDVSRVIRNHKDVEDSYILFSDALKNLMSVSHRKYPGVISMMIRDIPGDKFNIYVPAIQNTIQELLIGSSASEMYQTLYTVIEILNSCYYAITIGDGTDIIDYGIDEEFIMNESQWCDCYGVTMELVTLVMDICDIGTLAYFMELVYNRYTLANNSKTLDMVISRKVSKDIATAMSANIGWIYDEIQSLYSHGNPRVNLANKSPSAHIIDHSNYVKDVDFFDSAFGSLISDVSTYKKLAAVKYVYDYYGCGYYDKINGCDRMSCVDSNIDIVYIEGEKKILHWLNNILLEQYSIPEDNQINNDDHFINVVDKKFIFDQVDPVYDGYLTPTQREFRDMMRR
ncbi:MAG: hypothetical protein ACRCZ9_12275 [Fusobacteriaceae bacterium]